MVQVHFRGRRRGTTLSIACHVPLLLGFASHPVFAQAKEKGKSKEQRDNAELQKALKSLMGHVDSESSDAGDNKFNGGTYKAELVLRRREKAMAATGMCHLLSITK